VKTRYIKAKLFDLTSDCCVIIDGTEGEHFIIECGWAHIDSLESAIQKYRKAQKESAA
jgi:hypothetical protein